MKKFIYPASEDTFLLINTLEKEALKGKVIEIGTGSGIVGKSIMERGLDIIVTDINPHAIKNAKELGLKTIKSDLFENIDGKFDIIIFNAPYLPKDVKTDKWMDKATIGGKKGSEVIEKFLKQAKEHLKREGKIYLVFSSRTLKVREIAKELGYSLKVLSSKSFFFEKIFIAKLIL